MKAQALGIVGSLVVLAIFMGSAARADVSTGLVAYYPFNGSSNDASGNGHDGVVYGATLTTDRFGNPNSAYSFDGTDDYISVPYTAAFQLSAFTLSAWVRPSTNIQLQPPPVGAIIAARGEDFFTDHLWSSLDIHAPGIFSPGGIELDYEDSSDDDTMCATMVYPPLQSWTLVTATRSLDGDVFIYRDDAIIGHWTNTAVPATACTQELTIGARWYNASSEPYELVGFFPGSIDEVRLYDRPLSTQEVSELAGVSAPPPAPVPLPGAFLLGGIGLSYAGWRLRRETA